MMNLVKNQKAKLKALKLFIFKEKIENIKHSNYI